MALRIYLLLAAAGLLVTPGARAEDCPLVFPVSDAGWYNPANFHDPENNNYIAGHHAAGPVELRNFFVFDLPVLSGPVIGAQLRLFTFTINTPQSTETYELHHVATPVETLVTGAGPELTNVFNDLADGALYATRAITNSEANGYITITLNSNALAALNAASGQRFALGGRVTSLAAAPGVDEKLFAFSSGVAPYVELIITFAGATTPFFYQQPPPVLLTNSLGPISLTVEACGAEPLSYHWYFNGAPLLQTNSTITFPVPHSGFSGTYFAVASNVFGTTTSAPTYLLVDGTPPGIFFLEPTQTVVIGYARGFSPTVTGNPAPALQWYLAGLEIPGATNFYYEIPNVQPFHAAILTLVASNLLGVVTTNVVLEVEPLQLYGAYDQSVMVGEPAYPNVYVSSSVPVTYQWRFDGTNIPGANARWLTVPEAGLGALGPFDVVVANTYGARTSLAANVSGYLPEPYVIAGQPAISGAVTPQFGSDVLLRSQAQGAFPRIIQWFQNDQPIEGATNSQLVLLDFSNNHNGLYSYSISNAYGSALSPPLLLTAQAAGPALYPLASSRETFAGQTVGLQATAFGAPRPQFQWQRNGTNLPGATNYSLFFTNVKPADQGFYVLNASNFMGTSTVGISLNVQPRRALDRWSWRNSRPQANDLHSVAFGNGRLVAGGEGGSLVTSTNGVDWITTTLGQQFSLQRVVFGNGLFIALTSRYVTGYVTGQGDPYLLFISADGLNWEPQTVPMFESYTLDFVNGEFFLLGNDGSSPLRLARSTDARHWSASAVAATTPLGFAYGNGQYVLACFQQTLVSPDAVHWESFNTPFIPSRVTFGNGLFAISTAGGEVWTSPDGRIWTARTTPVQPTPTTTGDLSGLATGQGQFIAVGDDGAIVRSVNGATWTTANATTSRHLRDVIFTGTEWLVAGNDGVLLTSPNGVTWTDRRGGRTRDLYGIIYTNGQFVAVGYEGTMLTSPDAQTWTVRVSNTTRDLHAITYANGLYVAGGRVGTIITSPNAINWTVRATPTTNYIERLAWGAGRFVAAATHGTILSSTNGFTWTQHAHPAPPDTEFEGVAYGGGRFVMVGVNFDVRAHSVMIASSNGVHWIDTSVDVGKGLRGVGHDGNQFLAVGNDGVTLFSPTGLFWMPQEFITPFRNWRHVRSALGRFIVVGNEGATASYVTSISNNDFGWHPHASIVSQNLHDVAYGAGKFVAVGNAGAIVQSEFAVPFISGARHTNGLMRFNVTGGLEADYRIESSLFLNAWQTVGNYTNDGGSVTFTNAGNPFQGFYRAVSP